MRTLFIVCTAVILVQIFDVSITGVSSAPSKTDPSKVNGGPQPSPKTPVRRVKPTSAAPAAPAAPPAPPASAAPPAPAASDPANSDVGTNPNADDSVEAEPPKTFKESGKKVIKNLKRMATNKGVGLLNGVSGFLKKSGGVFNFFGNFLRERSTNVKEVAKQSLELVGSFSDSSTRGVSHLLNSGKVIATQGGKEMYSTLQKATKLGTNLVKLGGTIGSTPIAISEDIVGTANRVAKIPSSLSKTITNKAVKPVLSYFGTDSEEEQPEEADNGEPRDGSTSQA